MGGLMQLAVCWALDTRSYTKFLTSPRVSAFSYLRIVLWPGSVGVGHW